MTFGAVPDAIVEAAMERLLAAAPEERGAVCARLCAEHPAHARGLRDLLTHLDRVEGVLDKTFPALDPKDPHELGGHRVERRLGEGAFGVVYLCAQTRPVARWVAVKVLRPGVGDPATLQRFTTERQHLASLSHPTCTHVYDAGQLPDGRPYFVMEYVDGLPLTEYCTTHALERGERLRLFVDVCRGVHHAHERGVVHRDLKPANVLVVHASTGAQPKIIDFGIAKALAGSTGQRTSEPLTDTGRVLGTPGYMSPEQATGLVARVDERSDVFALGVILHEILTGALPWHRDAGRTVPRLRGDLARVVAKASATERDARYRSARELFEDVERVLAARPVLARPPTAGYRLARFVTRNRAATLVGALAVLVFGAGALAFLRPAPSAAVPTDAVAAVDALLLRANDESVLRAPQNEGVRRALAADALAFYEKWLRDRPTDPVLRAGRCRALTTLAQVHQVLGQTEAALASAERACGEAEALAAAAPADLASRGLLAEALRRRGTALQILGRWAEALPHVDRAVALLAECATRAPEHFGLSFSAALREQGRNHRALGREDGGEASTRRSVEVLEDLVTRRITTEAAASDLVFARLALAIVWTEARKCDLAEPLLARTEDEFDGVTVDRRRARAAVLLQRGRTARAGGDAESALTHFTRAMAAAEDWVAHEPRQYLASLVLRETAKELAHAHEALGRFAEADRCMQRAVDVGEADLTRWTDDGARVREVRATLHDFARALWNRSRRRDLALAAKWLERAVTLGEGAPGAAGPQRPFAWECASLRALLADSDGRPTDESWEAVAALLPAPEELRAREVAQGVVEAWAGVARARLRRGDREGAAAALRATGPFLEDGRFTIGKDHRSQVAWCAARLALANGDQATADREVARVLALRPSWWGHWKAGSCEHAAAQRLAAAGSPSEGVRAREDAAIAHLTTTVDALAGAVAKDPLDPWHVVPWAKASLELAELAHSRGDEARAEALRAAALPLLTRVEPDAHRD